jgi:hypothetical protein
VATTNLQPSVEPPSYVSWSILYLGLQTHRDLHYVRENDGRKQNHIAPQLCALESVAKARREEGLHDQAS